jgi:hypothetical protein
MTGKDEIIVRLKITLFAVLCSSLVWLQSNPAWANYQCVFTPTGQPICTPGLEVTCPLCVVPGIFRQIDDAEINAVKDTVNEIRSTINETQKAYNTMADTEKKFWGKKGKREFESDEMLRALTFPKIKPDDFPIPVFKDADGKESKTAVEIQKYIYDNYYINNPNPPVAEQLRMRGKRVELGSEQLVFAAAIAANRKNALFASDGQNPSLAQRLKDNLTQEVDAANKSGPGGKPEVLRLVEMRGALLRAMFAAQTSIQGLEATRLATEAVLPLARGEESVVRPDFADEVTREDAGPNQSHPALLKINEMTKTLDSANLRRANTDPAAIGTRGISGTAIAVSQNNPNPMNSNQPDLLYNSRLQEINFNMDGQRQAGEQFFNSPYSRAKLIETIHNARVMVRTNLHAIAGMDDTIACHEYSKQQLVAVRAQILPKLELDTTGNLVWGRYTRPTYAGPFPQNRVEMAFEAVAGRPATYEIQANGNIQANGLVTETPGVAGKLLQNDTTDFYTSSFTRHARATQAGCAVADQLMGNPQGIYDVSPDNNCRPKNITDYYYDRDGNSRPKTDTLYCLEDNTRQSLAPVVLRGNTFPLTALEAIRPGDACQMNLFYGQPAPPSGLFGKWLQAYKIEKFWASTRFGYAYTQQAANGSMQDQRYEGTHHYRREAWARITGREPVIINGPQGERIEVLPKVIGLNKKINEAIKALNDADDREAGGVGDTALPELDLTNPDDQWQSMQVQLLQIGKLDNEIAEKQRRLQEYQAQRNQLTPPANAPAEIQRQFQALVEKMEQSRQQIEADITTMRKFRDFAAALVDDRAGNVADTQSNNCFVYVRPRTVNVNTDIIETQQRRCVTLQPLERQCTDPSGRVIPHGGGVGTIYIYPGQIDQ